MVLPLESQLDRFLNSTGLQHPLVDPVTSGSKEQNIPNLRLSLTLVVSH